MSVPKKIGEFVGDWEGINKLWFSWHEDKMPKESNSVATIKFVAKRKFLSITYNWIYDDEMQEGGILIGHEKDSDKINAVWIDSFHNGDKFMVCDGTCKDNIVDIKGSYAVPDHPDWGWRTIIDFQDENSFKFVMYNVTPAGEETLAVESEYARNSSVSSDKSLNAVTK